MTFDVNASPNRYSRLLLTTEIRGERLQAVYVPFVDKGGRIVEAEQNPKLDDWAVERIASEPPEQMVDWWAGALAAGANLILGRHGAFVDQNHLDYLTRLGAFTVVEAVRGPGNELDRLEWELEHPPSLQVFASFLPAAVDWLSPDLMTVVFTRGFEEAHRVVENFSPADELWPEMWLRFAYRFFQVVHSTAFWPRLATWSVVYADEQLDERLVANIRSIATGDFRVLERVLSESSSLVVGATERWPGPSDPLENAAHCLSIFVAALLSRSSTPQREFLRLELESDDVIAIRNAITVRLRDA